MSSFMARGGEYSLSGLTKGVEGEKEREKCKLLDL